VVLKKQDAARTPTPGTQTIMMFQQRSRQPDMDAEARALFARLGLESSGAGSSVGGLYNPLDPIWRDKSTSGAIFVGNQQAAQNAALLKQHGITHIVNCTDSMPFFLQKDKSFTYYRFNVTFWSRGGETPEAVQKFLQPMFDFVEAAVAGGGSVLVHCLAGAHRAGTTGCLLLMREAGLSHMEAVATAKRLRPVIDPIGRFPELLRAFDFINEERRRTMQRERSAAASSASSGKPKSEVRVD